MTVCFLLSILPRSKINLSFLETACQLMGISAIDIHNSLCAMSQVGLVSKQNSEWTMNQIMKVIVAQHLGEQKHVSQQCVLEALLQSIRKETIGTLHQPLTDIDEDWSSVFDTTCMKPAKWDVINMFKQQELYLHLDHIIEHVLDDTFTVRLSWEQRDLCLRCLQWCRQKSTFYDYNRQPVQSRILELYASSDFLSKNSAHTPYLKGKTTFLRFFSARWSHFDIYQADAIGHILSDMETHLSSEFPVDLMELLVCLGEALLPTSVGKFSEKRRGLTVLQILAVYGVSEKSIKQLLQTIKNKVQLRCTFLYCRALGEAGRLGEAELILNDVVQVWKEKWRTFTVGCSELFVRLILSFSISFECCQMYTRCLFWSDLGFQFANSGTDRLKLPFLSLQACTCACKGILELAPGERPASFPKICEMWMQRVSVFLAVPFCSPLYHRFLFHNIIRLFLSLVIPFGLNHPLTLDAWHLLNRSFQDYHQLVRHIDVSTGVAFPLLTILILASGVKRKQDLNRDLLKCWGKVLAQQCRGDVGLFDLLIELSSTWRKLSTDQKCTAFGLAVVTTWRVCGRQGGSEDNPLMVCTAKEEINETSNLTPDPAVIREAIDVLISEAKFYGRAALARDLTDLFKYWPQCDSYE